MRVTWLIHVPGGPAALDGRWGGAKSGSREGRAWAGTVGSRAPKGGGSGRETRGRSGAPAQGSMRTREARDQELPARGAVCGGWAGGRTTACLSVRVRASRTRQGQCDGRTGFSQPPPQNPPWL